MKSKKKRKSVLNRFEKIGSFLVALLIVVFSYGYGDHFYSKIFELDPLLIFALGVLFTFLSVFVLAFIHEIGHVLFGLLCGFEFISFRVGNIMLLRKDGKLTITKDSIPGTAGDCRMAPPELVEGKILPFILNLSGGIAFNLLSAVIFAIPVFSRIDAPIFLLFCFVFVIMNLLANGKLPSNHVLEYSGKFDETRSHAIWEMVINIAVSVVAILYWGICGAIVGTIIALLYRGGMMIYYSNKKVLERSVFNTYKLWLVNGAIFAAIMAIFFVDSFSGLPFLQLLVKGVLHSLWIVPLYICVNLVLFKDAFKTLLEMWRNKK